MKGQNQVEYSSEAKRAFPENQACSTTVLEDHSGLISLLVVLCVHQGEVRLLLPALSNGGVTWT